MIGILLLVIIILSVILVYYIDKLHRQAGDLERYRSLVLEWYLYLNEKKHGEDFEMWRKELNE